MSEAPSFFECIYAMALWLFQEAGIKIAVLEAGLGGRLDATTTAHAELLGVSMIDFDHQAILGNSISAIATEKVSAARPWQKVVSVEQASPVRLVIEEAKKSIGFELWWSKPCTKPLGLLGEHQTHNAGLAISCLERLDVGVNASSIEAGLLEVSWPGRFEEISKDPYIVLDGAHNPSGICALIKAVKAEQKFAKQPLFLIFGSLKSVNTPAKIALLLELAPKRVYIHCSKNPRAEEAEELIGLFLAAGLKAPIAPLLSWNEAVSNALAQGASILVGGSLYTVGEARSFFLDVPTDPAQPNY
jgi:dihydrofolate synthase / folylpolyglutamate synthase